MSDLESTDWSELAANNIQPAPGGWPANSSPNIVYSTDREMMGAIKRDFNRRNPTVTSGGSANAQTLTYTQGPVIYITGQTFTFYSGFNNTGPTTLNVNGLGAKNVWFGGVALTGGELLVNGCVQVIYDGGQFQILAAATGRATTLGYLQLAGVTNGSDAPVGQVGEVMSGISGSVTLNTGVPSTLSTLALTAGDWDVSGEVDISFGTGGGSAINGWINNSAGFPGLTLNSAHTSFNIAFPASSGNFFPIRTVRASLASTTTYYLAAQATFPSGVCSAFGLIYARRVR